MLEALPVRTSKLAKTEVRNVFLETGGKGILVAKWQKMSLNWVLQLWRNLNLKAMNLGS